MTKSVEADGTAVADTVSDLLPCPFCGATPTGVQYGSYELCDGWNVSCTVAKDCPLFYATPYRVWDSMAEAIAAWNTRASENRPTPREYNAALHADYHAGGA